MLILDGMPGAGKTTALGSLLRQYPDVVLFPEARPPAAGDDETVMRHLLAEDHARTTEAARLRTHDPDRVVASDRCHLGVLAYRYALARLTGQWAAFDRALAHSREHALDERHHDDTVLILDLDPDTSRQHRRGHAHDERYHLWYEPEFLAHYRAFFHDLTRWSTPGPRWQHHHCAETDVDATLRALLPHQPAPLVLATTDLPCSDDCGSPRSATVATPHGATQLWGRGLHHQPVGEPVHCFTRATEITAHTEETVDGRDRVRHRRAHRARTAGDAGPRP